MSLSDTRPARRVKCLEAVRALRAGRFSFCPIPLSRPIRYNVLMTGKNTVCNRIALFAIAGSLAAVAASASLHLPPLSGDWLQALRPARDYLFNRPALSWPASPGYVPSPLTIVPFSLPFAFLDYRIGAALFFGLSCGWLAAGLNQRRFLLIPLFLSFPFFENVLYIQYAPFLMALALSDLSPLGLLVKPHIALPLVLTHPYGASSRRFRWWSLLIAGAIVAWSLLTFGPWPLRWLQEIRPYSGSPLILNPLGLIAFLLALASRQPLLALYCLVPLRSPYDLLPLFLTFKSFRPVMLFALVTWLLGFYAVWFAGYSSEATAAMLCACAVIQAYGPFRIVLSWAGHRANSAMTTMAAIPIGRK